MNEIIVNGKKYREFEKNVIKQGYLDGIDNKSSVLASLRFRILGTAIDARVRNQIPEARLKLRDNLKAAIKENDVNAVDAAVSAFSAQGEKLPENILALVLNDNKIDIEVAKAILKSAE